MPGHLGEDTGPLESPWVVIEPAAFDPAGACAYLGNVYTESALAKRRQRGQGPPFRRDEAGRILYAREDLDAFVASLPQG